MHKHELLHIYSQVSLYLAQWMIVLNSLRMALGARLTQMLWVFMVKGVLLHCVWAYCIGSSPNANAVKVYGWDVLAHYLWVSCIMMQMLWGFLVRAVCYIVFWASCIGWSWKAKGILKLCRATCIMRSSNTIHIFAQSKYNICKLFVCHFC